MKTLKTYGVPGYIDWVADFKVGAATKRIVFEGGSLVQNAETPAKYTTTSALDQAIIENSAYFKSGRIILVNSIPVAGGEPETVAHKLEPRPVQKPVQAEPADVARNEAETAALKVVNVKDREDAVNYLKEINPKYTSTHLRTKANLDAAAQECGIEFHYED